MLYQARYGVLRREMARIRSAAGLTQAELATRLGKGQSFVSKVETGERYLDVMDFLSWCDAVNVDAAEILVTVRKVPARA